MEHSDQLDHLATALAQAQSTITGALKDGSNPHYGSTFATLQSCIEASRTALSENGLSVVQGAETNEETGGVRVATMLLHKSGQWIRSTLTMTPEAKKMASNPAQAYGSCVTYARRYGYSGIIGLYQTDDDGEGAGRKELKARGVKSSSGRSKPTATRVATDGKATAKEFISSLPPNLAKSKQVQEWVRRFESAFPGKEHLLMKLAGVKMPVAEFIEQVRVLAEEIKQEARVMDDEQPSPPLQ